MRVLDAVSGDVESQSDPLAVVAQHSRICRPTRSAPVRW
jgi:hypothetical protein